MIYNPQLGNTAWEKKHWHELRSIGVFDFSEVVIFRW
jgi:hypothetical protein